MKNKYKLITIGDIHVGIGIGNENYPGYYEKIIEPILPTDEEADKMSDFEFSEWLKENNRRMVITCKALNKNEPK